MRRRHGGVPLEKTARNRGGGRGCRRARRWRAAFARRCLRMRCRAGAEQPRARLQAKPSCGGIARQRGIAALGARSGARGAEAESNRCSLIRLRWVVKVERSAQLRGAERRVRHKQLHTKLYVSERRPRLRHLNRLAADCRLDLRIGRAESRSRDEQVVQQLLHALRRAFEHWRQRIWILLCSPVHAAAARHAAHLQRRFKGIAQQHAAAPRRRCHRLRAVGSLVFQSLQLEHVVDDCQHQRTSGAHHAQQVCSLGVGRHARARRQQLAGALHAVAGSS